MAGGGNNISWTWNDAPVIYPGGNGRYPTGSDRLTGTYSLDATRSDDPHDAADRAVRNVPVRERQRALDAMTARLESPDRLAIEKRGQNISLASSRGAQATFVADGSERNEQDRDGNTVRVSATLNGEQLIVTSNGQRSYDSYEVTFEPFNNGRNLRVTRRISNQYTYRPVVSQSVYNKISEVAQLGQSNSPDPSNPPPRSNNFIVPSDTVILATLDNELNTKTVQENDRFTMRVQAPVEFNGAIISGYISGVARSGRATGRSQMTLNFETIQLTDGSEYRFTGLVESVRTQGGEEVQVNNEGTVRENESRTSTTTKRAAVGSAIGAVIGAIAGGGKGAAIGAVVGAGAGAGSVYVQGKDDLVMGPGTELKVRSTSPSGTR